jgi:adenine-specific DNA-methyltransferase
MNVAPSLNSYQEQSGAYYTSDDVVTSLMAWSIRDPRDRVLDPSCGDGRFLVGHRNSTGAEQNPHSAWLARQQAPHSTVHDGDFFEWASQTVERFDCAAGNPAFHSLPDLQGRVANF